MFSQTIFANEAEPTETLVQNTSLSSGEMDPEAVRNGSEAQTTDAVDKSPVVQTEGVQQPTSSVTATTIEPIPSNAPAPRTSAKAPAQTEKVASIDGTGYETIQAAINASIDNNIIALEKDTTENITFTNKNVTFDLKNHTLFGDGKNTIITINGGNVIIQNGTLKNGFTRDSNEGSAIYSFGGANITLKDLVLTENKGPGYNTAVIAVSNNRPGANVTMSNVTITDNTGTALYVRNVDGTTTIRDLIARNNTVEKNSSVLYCVELFNAGTTKMNHVTLIGNSGYDSILNLEDVNLEADQLEIRSNEVYSSPGGAMYVEGNDGSTLILENTVITDNTNDFKEYGTSVGGLVVTGKNDVTLKSGAIYNNHADNKDVKVSSSATLTLPSASSMIDEDMDFSSYIWLAYQGGEEISGPLQIKGEKAYQAVSKNNLPMIAQIGNTKYHKFEEALAAAKDGDTIVIIAEPDTLNIPYTGIPGNAITTLTIDLNGHTIATDSVWLFYISEGKIVKLINSSKTGAALQGFIYNVGSLVIEDTIELDWVYPDGETKLNNTQKDLFVVVDQNVPELQDQFKATRTITYCAYEDRVVDEWNQIGENDSFEQVILFKGGNDEIARLVSVSGLENKLLYVTYDAQSDAVVLRKIKTMPFI